MKNVFKIHYDTRDMFRIRFGSQKYFLNGFFEAQTEINEFIKKCKVLENEQGYLSRNIFNLEFDKNYKFISGPFVQKIFKIISFQKKTIDIQMGNLKTRIDKEKFLFNPI